MTNHYNNSNSSEPAYPPLSLYVHVPWCIRKCPYCDFNSHTQQAPLPEEAYLQALISDLEQDICLIGDRPIISIFFGGGTPSLLTPSIFGRFLKAVSSRIDVMPHAEITLEANPGTLDAQRLEGLLDAGVNRLSLGVQSFNPQHLHVLGRIHDGQVAIKAAQDAFRTGFKNFNLDLMFGLPEQSPSQVKEDVEQAAVLAPTHISFYQLTLEPNTLFFRFPPPLPDDEVIWEAQSLGQAALQHHGFSQYEVSAWSVPGKQCQHNLNYWRFGDYLGIGAGAHGKLTLGDDCSVLRYSKQRHPQRYLDTASTAERLQSFRHLLSSELPLEYLMNQLRLRDGFTVADYESRTGLAFDAIRHQILSCQHDGLLAFTNDRWRCTSMGWNFVDDILTRFVP